MDYVLVHNLDLVLEVYEVANGSSGMEPNSVSIPAYERRNLLRWGVQVREAEPFVRDCFRIKVSELLP